MPDRDYLYVKATFKWGSNKISIYSKQFLRIDGEVTKEDVTKLLVKLSEPMALDDLKYIVDELNEE